MNPYYSSASETFNWDHEGYTRLIPSAPNHTQPFLPYPTFPFSPISPSLLHTSFNSYLQPTYSAPSPTVNPTLFRWQSASPRPVPSVGQSTVFSAGHRLQTAIGNASPAPRTLSPPVPAAGTPAQPTLLAAPADDESDESSDSDSDSDAEGEEDPSPLPTSTPETTSSLATAKVMPFAKPPPNPLPTTTTITPAPSTPVRQAGTSSYYRPRTPAPRKIAQLLPQTPISPETPADLLLPIAPLPPTPTPAKKEVTALKPAVSSPAPKAKSSKIAKIKLKTPSALPPTPAPATPRPSNKRKAPPSPIIPIDPPSPPKRRSPTIVNEHPTKFAKTVAESRPRRLPVHSATPARHTLPTPTPSPAPSRQTSTGRRVRVTPRYTSSPSPEPDLPVAAPLPEPADDSESELSEPEEEEDDEDDDDFYASPAAPPSSYAGSRAGSVPAAGPKRSKGIKKGRKGRDLAARKSQNQTSQQRYRQKQGAIYNILMSFVIKTTVLSESMPPSATRLKLRESVAAAMAEIRNADGTQGTKFGELEEALEEERKRVRRGGK